MSEPVEVMKPTLYKFTNSAHSEQLDNILAMFYTGVYDNIVGIMQSFNLEKSEEELILVGVTLDDDGKPDCYPLAKILSAEEVKLYQAPNGEGGYYDPLNSVEAAGAKENMKSFNEAIIEPEVAANG